jgi:hypothetical protein
MSNAHCDTTHNAGQPERSTTMTTTDKRSQLAEECRDRIWELLTSYPLFDNDHFDEKGYLTREGHERMEDYVMEELTGEEKELEEEFQILDKAQQRFDDMVVNDELPGLLDEAGERRYRSTSSAA